MNFAILGEDPELLPLVRTILADARHAIVAYSPTGGDLEKTVGPLAPGVRRSFWEEWLTDDAVDLILVGGSDPETLEAVRKLGAGGKRLWVLPRAEQGIDFTYELSFLRDDRPEAVTPVFPRREHPLVLTLRERIREGELGRISHWQFERLLPGHPQRPGSQWLATDEIEAALLADLDLLCELTGPFERLTAVRSGVAAEGVVQLTVTLSADEAAEVTWTCRRGSAEPGFRLSAHGETRTAELMGDTGFSTLQLQVTGATGELARAESATMQTAPGLLARLLDDPPRRPHWDEAVRDFELIEATRRSIHRRRTIDLHFEGPSERSHFKTQMTALGCGVLVLTFLGVLVLLAFGAAIRDLGVPPVVMQIARAVVFAPLGIFLLLQLLVFLTRPGERELARQVRDGRRPTDSLSSRSASYSLSPGDRDG